MHDALIQKIADCLECPVVKIETGMDATHALLLKARVYTVVAKDCSFKGRLSTKGAYITCWTLPIYRKEDHEQFVKYYQDHYPALIIRDDYLAVSEKLPSCIYMDTVELLERAEELFERVPSLKETKAAEVSDAPNLSLGLSLSEKTKKKMQLVGRFSQPMQAKLRRGIRSIVLASLGLCIFALSYFVGASFPVALLANTLFSGGFIYLISMSYSIVHARSGCKRFLPYYLLGHHKQHDGGLLESNDPTTVGIAWGIFDKQNIALYSGAFFFTNNA